ncbi:MAG TPA: LysM domain-containing protein [Candidatus Elarobacter sp.]
MNPALHVVASFFVDNGIDPNARTATEVRTGGAPGSSFDSLAQGVLRWSFAAAGVAGLTGESGARVTSTAIAQLLTNLQDAAASEAAFSYDNVAGPTGFLAANYVVGFEPAQFDEQSGSLTVFPIPSAFSITPSDGSPVDLWNTACVDAAYRTQFETYYDQMRVAPASAEAGAGPHALRSRRLRAPHGFMRAESLPSSCPDGTTPLSAVVFGDYFALIAKSALQSASDLLTAYPYHATIGDSLASLAAEFGGGDAITVTARRGDTIASIAASLGIEPHVVARANAHLAGPRSLAHAAPLHARLHAGTDVTVPAGPTVGTIATANENVTLAPARGTLLTIDGVVTQVTSGQTMAGLASAFALGASAIFAGDGANASSTSLLRPGATGFMVPPIGYTVTAADMADDPADPLDRIGAVYYVRGNGPLGATAQQYVPWYMQQIGATGATGPSSTTEYVVPRASLSGGVIGATGATTSYAVRDQFDTLERVAKYFALIQLAEARPASFTQFVAEISAPSNVGPGTTIVIPTFSYAGATGDSLAGLAAIFSAGQTGQAALDPGALVGMNAGADVLQPLAVVNVPPFQATLESGDTLATIAQRYDLTVDALADSIAGATGIFAPGPTGGVTLTIPDVVSRDVDTLLGDMVARGEFNGLASTVSRFLMNGMRVAPVNDDPDWTPTAGLYSVIGQQLAAPAPGATLTLSFAAGPTAPWMAFYANGPTGPTSASLDVVLGATFIAANAPSLNLDPQIAGGPRGMTAYDDVPVRYPAPQNAHWQSATGPSLPGPTGGIAGQPSLWYFPPSLLAVTSQLSGATAATGPFEVVALAKNAQFGATATPPALERCAFAMTVELRIQRVLAADGNPIPNRYLLIGADETGRDLLLAAWQFARNGMRPFGDRLDQLYLLYAPPGAGNGSGFASDALGAGVVVLRTNLSTVTHPNRMMLAAAFGGDSSVFDAPITQPANFMQTVWEASITGSGGYYLQYQTAHGNGFPDGLFTGSPEATIRLVYLSFEQWSGQDQQLHPYTNCAVVGENVDAGSTTIYLNMPPGTGPTRRVATIPAGAVGFELTRVNPSGNTDAPDLTRSLYDVLSYRVESNPYFSESHFGRPIGPVSPAGATGTWLYRQIVPVAQFGLVNDGPTANSQAGFALPNPAQNPYAGITFGPGPTDAAQLSAARIDLFFNDVFGNAIGPSGTVAPVDVTAGYTDDLVAVSSWPGAALAYRLSATGPNGAQLSVDLTLDTTRAIPSSSLPVATANAAAVADAARYATVFYQVQQRDLTFALDCNLGVPHQQGDELKGPLAAFVTKAKLFADAASSLSPVTGYWFGGRGATFGAMARAFAVTPGALFAANPDAIVAAVFAPADGATQLLEPVLRAAQSPDTLASLAALGTYDLVALVTVNAAVPLRVGATLYAAAARTVPVVVTPAATLAATAAATSSAIYFVNGTSAETGLVVDNWTAANLVAPNLRITIGKTTKVTPAAPSSFADVYAQFSDADIDRGTFANAIAGVAGIWASGATQITSSSYWVQPVAPAQYKVAQPVTFGTIGTSLGPVETLVELNRAVPYLFVAGSVVQVGENSIALEPGTTFAEAAQQANLTLAQLGTANAAAPLQVFEQPPPVHSDIALTVPNLVELRERGWAAYTPISGDTLASIAAQFSPGDPVGATGALATLNRYLRGIITPGPIAIGGTSYTVTAGDSLDTLAARVGGGFDAFVAKAASVAGLFWPAAAVVVPGPALALNLTLAEVATGFGLSATDGVLSLFRANQSLRGFLAAGTRSVAFGPLKTTIEVGVYDTPGTLVQRLREEQGIDVTLDQLCTAVADIVGLLATGDVRYFMLPPNATPIATLLTPTIPPAGPAAYYPVTVSLGMSRAPELIVPDFAGTAVANVVTRISAAAFAAGATADGALLAFAQDFESAFAPFRLKCAVGDVPSAGGTDRASIYAVDFGPQGIAQLAIQADQPAFYSLPPISTSLVTGTYTVTDPSGATAAKSLQDADPQTWLETFLAATDLMLSAPYALPAYAAAGPTAYETIVDAKLAVATALSNEVAPILAGATGSAPAAVDALYQQMLVELASAYRTTAIVQFPVDVTSPPPAGATIAPRLFGPVATDAFTLPPGSTGPTGLAAFATQLGVAPAYLAQLVAGQRGLLAPGMTVEYAGKPYRIGSNDTLIDVAAQFGVTFPAGPSAGWWTQTWTPFIEGSLTGGPSGIAEQPTVYATTPLQVTRIAREFGRGEPFTAAADFFGDPIAFGRANQDLGAMFLAGCTIGFGPAGPTYVTTGAPSETIRTIAQALGDSDVDDVLTVMEASPLPPKLSGGTLQGAATTSGFTLSSTKLSLASGASPYLTFLLSVADASAARTLFLNTRFAPTDLEYAIATVPGAGAYESSSWLRFVIPPDEGFLPGSVMPQTQVPIPLREYPGPPILTGNSGTQENPNATTIACAKLWSYAFDVMRQEAAQDQDYVAASFYRSTRPANDLVAAFVLGDDLIAALAQFAFAWPALRDDLAPLPASPASPDLKAAVEAFAFYAAAIAVAMSSGQFANLMSGTNDPNLAERYEFSVRRAPGAELTGLNLTWTEATGPGASATAPWPQIAIVAGLAGPSGPVDPLTGPLPPVGATAAVYRYPPGYLADERLTQRYAFGGRDVARNERASGGAFVTRNAELISSGPIGAAGSTGPYGTNPKFIYQTPLVEFIDPLVPSLTCTTPIDLAPPGTAPQPLWAFIAQMLDAITSNAVADGLSAHWIELLCSYQFSTSGTDDGIFATIPLGLRPTPASGMTPPYDAYARELAAAIYAALPPGVLTTGGKRLSFAARLFTNIPDPNGAAELKPVLSYDDLFVRAAMITSPT